MAYKLELLPNLSQVHDVFHVSQLRRYFKDPVQAVDHEMLELREDLSYQEYPILILDQDGRRTRQKTPGSLKFSGRIILKKKPLRNAKIVFVKNTLLSFSLPLNSRDENFF